MVKNLAVQRMTNGGVGIGDNDGGVEEPVGAEDSLLLRRGLINGKTKAVKTVAGGVDDHNKALDDDRGTWGSKFEFLLSCLSFAVGLGNIWRFPYLCYQHGGGAFLIPYALNLVFTGLPLFYFELSLGQYAKSSPISLWSICPAFKGVGYSMLIIVIGIGLYYNVLNSWIIYYLGMSIISAIEQGKSYVSGGNMSDSQLLPWSNCNNSWNTEQCVENTGLGAEEDYLLSNSTDLTLGGDHISAADEYFHRSVLQLHLSSGIHDIQGLRVELAGCLLIAWALVYIALLKGVKSLGKVVYFTAIFPYFILVVLLVKGLTLPGAMDGIYFYVNPNWSKLTDMRVWADASMQIFFSLGPCWGSLITLASYNKFNNNTLRDAVIIATANCFTSFFAGFVVFSFIGFMAHSLGKSIEEVTVSGPGLAFIVYPEALSLLPFSGIWSVLFFVMLLSLGLGTQFSIMETISRTISDIWNISHRVVLTVACTLMFLLGLTMTTNGGMYILTIMNNHSGTFPALVTGMVEVLVVSWIYGAERFLEDIRRMIGWKKSSWWYASYRLYWNIMWRIATPILLFIILLASAVDFQPPEYGGYVFPYWAGLLGWMISFASMACIPLAFIYMVFEVDCTERIPRIRFIGLKDSLSPLPSWGNPEKQFYSMVNTEETVEPAII